MGASKSFQTLPPRFSPFAVELEGDPNGPFQRLATFLVGNMCSYPFSVMGLENLDRDGGNHLGYFVGCCERTDSNTWTVPRSLLPLLYLSVLGLSPI